MKPSKHSLSPLQMQLGVAEMVRRANECDRLLHIALGRLDEALADVDQRRPRNATVEIGGAIKLIHEARSGLSPIIPPISTVQVTQSEREEMLHALGSSHVGSKLGFRNYFCTDAGNALWESLVERGLASRGKTINDGRDQYYSVTKAGCEAIGQPEAFKRWEESR